jgi:hypothetical protein
VIGATLDTRGDTALLALPDWTKTTNSSTRIASTTKTAPMIAQVIKYERSRSRKDLEGR